MTNLLPQLGDVDLDDEERRYFILQDTSPVRPRETLYSLETGEPWRFYKFRIPALIATGRWTRTKDEAPTVTVMEYPCFLAPQSEIRAELDALGIVTRCNSKHPSKFSMEQVAAKKHPNTWAAWRAHLAEKERQAERDRLEKQTEAMMALAQQGQPQPRIKTIEATAPAEVIDPCECGWDKAKNAQSLAAHKRLHCPLKGTA